MRNADQRWLTVFEIWYETRAVVLRADVVLHRTAPFFIHLHGHRPSRFTRVKANVRCGRDLLMSTKVQLLLFTREYLPVERLNASSQKMTRVMLGKKRPLDRIETGRPVLAPDAQRARHASV